MSTSQRTPIRGKVLVTGTSGFIGGHLRDALIADGAEVVSLLRAVSPGARKGRAVAVDYCDVAALTQLMAEERPDYVFHVAGATKGVRFADFRAANVVPTCNLLEALLSGYPTLKRFVFVSSLTAYGPSNDGPPKGDADRPQPIEFYGRSKLDAERLIQSFGERLPWTIIRPSAVYGPAEVDMFTLFKAAKLGVNLFYGNRDKRFSAVYVDDLVAALLHAAVSEQTRSRGYMICDGVPHTWGEFQRHVVAAIGKPTFELSLPSFLVPMVGIGGELLTALDKKPRVLNRQKALLDAQSAWLCTHQAAHADFGYQPSVEMAEGTRRAYKWYVQNGWL